MEVVDLDREVLVDLQSIYRAASTKEIASSEGHVRKAGERR